jgi:sensor histidine kinase YesM
MTTTKQQPFLRWALIIGGWTIFGLFMAGQIYFQLARAGHPVVWKSTLFQEMVYAYAWAALTPLILYLSRRFPVDAKRWIAHTAFHIVACYAIAIVHRIIFYVITMAYEATPANAFSMEKLYASMFSYLDYGILIYWFLLLLQHSLEYFQRYKENEVKASQLETQLAVAQLQSLKMQLQPHFLFNTLNAISVLIDRHPDTARHMILKLADLLRMTLENGNAQEIPLRQELELLDNYMQIEQTRFEDRLKVTMNIEPDTLNAIVPNLILQPIVENAMRHGVAAHRGSATVEVSATRQNGSLLLQVKDNGPGIARPHQMKEGIGFSNTNARLRQLYGKKQRFEITNAAEGGCIATIVIPFHSETMLTAA